MLDQPRAIHDPPVTTVQMFQVDLAELAFNALHYTEGKGYAPPNSEYVLTTNLVLRRFTAVAPAQPQVDAILEI